MDMSRVLFVGNSITIHEPAPEIGWYGNWGMAASSIDKDYMHLVMEGIRAKNPRVRFMFRNIAEYEHHFWEFNIETLSELKEFNADVIIMRIGENVDDKEAGERGFDKYYKELTGFLNSEGKAIVVCTNCFWKNENKDLQIKKVAMEQAYIHVDISEIHMDEKNMAKSEYENKEVGWHPSNKGMKEIAERILEGLRIGYGK